MSHTPGPWTLEKDPPHLDKAPDLPPYWHIDAGAESADIGGFHIGAFLIDADAHLIAAAPELLEACKRALPYLEEFGGTAEPLIREQMEAAIAKAEGVR